MMPSHEIICHVFSKKTVRTTSAKTSAKQNTCKQVQNTQLHHKKHLQTTTKQKTLAKQQVQQQIATTKYLYIRSW